MFISSRPLLLARSLSGLGPRVHPCVHSLTLKEETSFKRVLIHRLVCISVFMCVSQDVAEP